VFKTVSPTVMLAMVLAPIWGPTALGRGGADGPRAFAEKTNSGGRPAPPLASTVSLWAIGWDALPCVVNRPLQDMWAGGFSTGIQKKTR